ncbi:MAG: hypothetical protein GY754_45380 [bacterium]|nr:hypothetical protein [bacterium]
MKKKSTICLASLMIAVVMVFSGCEAGLMSEDGANGSSGDSGHFSFSDIYGRLNKHQEEIEQLKLLVNAQQQIINEQEALIENVTNSSLAGLESRVGTIETMLGNAVPYYRFLANGDNYYSTDPTVPWGYISMGVSCYVLISQPSF